jgi:helix-turn-helix protein
MTHTTFLAPAKSSIRLCKGRTYEEYIIRLNATKAPICDLCEYLKISFDELRKIYDRVYNVPLAKIGRLKRKAPTESQLR